MARLRDYQASAVGHAHGAFAAGLRCVPLVMATGLGKTEVFTDPSMLDRYLNAGQRVLIIAHTDELIDQAARKARANNPKRRVGIVKAERNETHAQIVVSSRQTLGHATGGPRRLAALRNVGLIVIDEAHHAVRGNTYGKILDHFGAFTDSALEAKIGPHVLGVTATLVRGDKAKLSTVWQDGAGLGFPTFRRDILFGIRRGYLLDVIGRRIVVPGLDMRNVGQSNGDYQAGDIGDELERVFAPEVVAARYAEECREGDAFRKGILFAPLVETAEHFCEAFNALGIASEVIHGELPKQQRRAILRRLHTGETRVVHGVGVLTEGFDEPTVDVVVIARPTRSAGLYQQMVGRVLRPDLTLPPERRGKALILDVVGAGAAHDLRSMVDLAPERHLRRDAEEMSLLDLDVELIGIEEQIAAGAGEGFQPEVYAGETEIREFDPLGEARQRKQVWQQTPGGAFYVSAGGDAYVFLAPSVEGEPSHYDVVACSKIGPHSPMYDRRVWAREGKSSWVRGDATDLPFEEALLAAEELSEDIGGYGHKELTKRAASWRKGAPKDGVLRKAAAMRLRVPEGANAGQVSELIDAELARLRLDPLLKAVTDLLARQAAPA